MMQESNVIVVILIMALVSRHILFYRTFGRVIFKYISPFDKMFFTIFLCSGLFLSVFLIFKPNKDIIPLLLLVITLMIYSISGKEIREKGIIDNSKNILWKEIKEYKICDKNNIIIVTNKKSLIRKEFILLNWLVEEHEISQVTRIIDENIKG